MRTTSIVSLCAASLFIVSSAFAATPPVTSQYAGHCAYGLSMGKAVPTDCSVTWVHPSTNKTFCFLNDTNKAEWAKSIPTNEAKADAEYAKIQAMKTSEASKASAMNQAKGALDQANKAVAAAESAGVMAN